MPAGNPMIEATAAKLRALGEPDESQSRSRCHRVGADREWVAHEQDQDLPRPSGHENFDGRVRSMLARIGQALLENPIGSPADRPRYLLNLLGPVAHVNSRAGLPFVGDQSVQIAQSRLRPLRLRVLLVAAQHAEYRS